MKPKMKRLGLSGLLALGLAGGLPGLATADSLDFTGIGFVQYGDALSFSLPIANLQVGEPNNPGSTFYVRSTPGAIQDLIVVATGSSGTGVNTNFTGMDNAYPTPSGVSGDIFFSTTLVTDPPPDGNATATFRDQATTWDTNLAALKNFLAGEQMVIFFNNNEVNNLGAFGQSLAAWAQIQITDAAGNVIAQFDFTNRSTFGEGPQPYDLITAGGGGTFFGDPTLYTSPIGYNEPVAFAGVDGFGRPLTDYVLSGGQICVAHGGAITIPIPVPCGTDPTLLGGTDITLINHNLGANQAAYAIIFPELNALLDFLFATLPDAALEAWALHAHIRLGCDPAVPPAFCSPANHFGMSLNNGFEQMFIATTVSAPTGRIPEPGSLVLLALGLFVLYGLSRSRRRKA